YSRLNSSAKAMHEAFLSYRFNDAALTAYEYFWNDFCDWYVEASKLSIRTSEDSSIKTTGKNTNNAAEKDRAAAVLLDVLAESLRLLHPLLPFVTEEIYGKLPNTQGLLITAAYPQYSEKRSEPDVQRRFAFLQEFVRMIRTLRSECTIPPDKKLRVIAGVSGEPQHVLQQNEELVKLLAGIGELEIQSANETAGKRPEGSIGLAGSCFEAFVFIAEAIDISSLKQKFNKEIERDRLYIKNLQVKLANEQFIKNAPPELVLAEKAKLNDTLARIGKVESYLSGL
ncbi:MAG: class I tRNA ligase family protein, partial [Treponema sp.]|nr:class I tRNA ligase family protein [Treponema sp.]